MNPKNVAKLTPTEASRIVAGIARGMQRRGLAPIVDIDDLRQEGEIAIWKSGYVGPKALAATIARNAMHSHLRRRKRECRGVSLEIGDNGSVINQPLSRDPFLASPLEELEDRHADWLLSQQQRDVA